MNAPTPRGDSAVTIHRVHVTPCHDPSLRATGIQGFATVLIGPFRIDGLVVRRREDGRMVVTWPARKTARRLHPIVTAIDEDVRRNVEAAVVDEWRRSQ